MRAYSVSARRLVIVLTLSFAGILATTASASSGAANDTCLMCHADAGAKRTDGRPIAVDAKAFSASVHGQMNFKCTDCHADVAADQVPHAPKLKPANCAGCHEAAVKDYAAPAHAKARAGGNMVAATCSSCHGSHDTQKSSEPTSRTHFTRVEATCAACHGNEALIQQAKMPGGNVASKYHDSIHGQLTNATGASAARAPNCASCHGAHNIVGKADAGSRVNRENVALMCGSCHQQVYSRFTGSQHGQLRHAGNSAAPTCIDCHSAHTIQARGTTQWQVDVIKECDNCHQDFIKSYRDTYHGQVTQLGFTRVATCSSCHGAHEVLPASNPKSMISPENRVTTCRSCHPGANANFAAFKPHGNPHDREGDPILYFTRLFMQLLLAGVFTFFGIHTLLWLMRSLKEVKQRRGGGK